MRVAYLTAGAAGMYCGSCMHDNTLARALIARGVDCLLVPTYTPIRTDERDISDSQVFFGGINIFLEQKFPLWGRLPAWLTHWLDRPGLLRMATRNTAGASPALLGNLTVSMLQGMQGRQRAEVTRLCGWLDTHVSPDVVVLSNFLIGGCVSELKKRLGAKIVVTLQGDDIFLDYLPEKQRGVSIDLMRHLAEDVDLFLVNSAFYGKKMASMLGLSIDKMRVIPLGIDTKPFEDDELFNRERVETSERPLRLGYLARLDPAKGLHRLVDAVLELKRLPNGNTFPLELHVAGWLGKQHEPWADEQWKRLKEGGFDGRFFYHGSPDHQGKLDFLKRMDLFCVPTEYEECKGLFVLEAMAAGVPVIAPRHGVFPEMLESEQRGVLVPPGDAPSLAAAIVELAGNVTGSRAMSIGGRQFVMTERSIDRMAERVHELFLELL
ncbi:MAG: glycosyltransferase family 4 protein [Pirellulaceae bacterium]